MRLALRVRLCFALGAVVAAPAYAADSLPAPASGGEPTFETIGLRQGLTSSATFAVAVDRHGFVWFAGDNGVHRYDGHDVLTIDRDPDRPDTLASRTNSALAETSEAIWLLSFSGLLQRLDAGTGDVTQFELRRRSDDTPAGRGTTLVADRRERLWIGTDIGLFRFDPETQTHAAVRVYDDADPRITALALDDDGRRLYVGSVDGRLAALDTDEPSLIEALLAPEPTPPPPVPLSLLARRGALWVGTNQGLFRFRPDERVLDRATVPPELGHGRVDALVMARDGTLWLGAPQRLGLIHFDPESGDLEVYRHYPDDAHSLTSDRVAALAMDARDNLWIGLQTGGASRLRVSQQGALRYRGESRAGNSFCAIQAWSDGRLLVAQCGDSVALLDPRTGEIEDRRADLDRALDSPAPTLSTHALIPDARGGYWVPTANLGLLHWDPQTARTTRFALRTHDGRSLPDPYMNHAMLDGNGRLWVACSLGLAVLAPGADHLTLLDRNMAPGKALTGGALVLAPAEGGALWIGSTRGLLRYDPESQQTESYAYDVEDAQSLSDNLVVSLYVDRAGTLWAGTQAGLNRTTTGADGRVRFRRYGVADGLPDQTIDAIVSDARSTLWVGTNQGIARLDAQRDRFRAFSPGDGVSDSGINWRAAWAAPDGSVYFGSMSGLLRILPDRISSAEPQPVMLSAFEVGGVPRINLRGSRIAPLSTSFDQARVRFQLADFGDTRPLSYRLSGLDSTWRDVPANLSVSYGPLPPDQYRFEVRQMASDGNWSSPLLSVPVTVTPPPWRTLTAYFAYVAAGLTLLALLANFFRQRRAREREHLRELHHLANFDALTGLPNRARFTEELVAAMRPESAPLALLFIDLDRFKNINDSLGHRFGDRVLIAAAQRLQTALPASAQLARLGGDEFTVILPQRAHELEAVTAAQALLSAFTGPLRVDGSDVVVTLSIGISLFPAHTRDPAQLVQYADSAMYYAKSAGRNAFRTFQPEMVAQVSRRLALETGLRTALENGELYPVFQPKFDVATARLCGAEALLRWQSPEHGAVSPAEFIPILEDTGMIESVGLWLVECVCRQLRSWHESGLGLPSVAVNVSVHQLVRGDLCDRLAELLTSLELPRQALELEVTESALMENAQRMGAALSELRSLGLGLAIDDFGTGYSSFASLAHLPVGKLKIDKIFIDGLGESGDANTLCAAMIAMAHNLKLIVVAEGVESERQVAQLQQMDCDEAQGFWYCKPLPLPEFERFLRETAARSARV